MTSAFLARQPILDRDQSVAGYELVYPRRDADDEHVDDALSTARVAVTALSEIGLENLVGQSRAWISVSPEFLSQDLARNLPPDRVVLQLGAVPFGGRSALDVVTELRRGRLPARARSVPLPAGPRAGAGDGRLRQGRHGRARRARARASEL